MTTSSMKDVARAAGVSVGTVSNVLNRPEAVAEDTRRRVLAAIAELGYVRNDSARQLRAGRSRNVAIVVLDVANPFFTDVVRGAEPIIEAAGGVVTVCDSGEDVRREARQLEILEEQRVLGLLITPVDDTATERLERLGSHDIPVVLVDRGAGLHPHTSLTMRHHQPLPAGASCQFLEVVGTPLALAAFPSARVTSSSWIQGVPDWPGKVFKHRRLLLTVTGSTVVALRPNLTRPHPVSRLVKLSFRLSRSVGETCRLEMLDGVMHQCTATPA
jgi:hypothetical protein